jgi:hypothetical protein
MRFLPAFLLLFPFMASAQTAPIDVQFQMLAMKDNYDATPAPVAGAAVRLVLGDRADWQEAHAGHEFVTNEKGEARFTMEAPIDSHTRSRNIGFTPFSKSSRTEHLKIAVELDHRFPVSQGGPLKNLRWLLTMDLDCFPDGQCSTVGFMGIYSPDAHGRFTQRLVREGSYEAWKVPELGNQVVWGMSYQVADFMLSADEKDPKKRTLKFAVKRLARP